MRETQSTFKQYMYSNITSGKKIRIVVIITVHCTDIYNKCLRLPDDLATFSSGTPHKSFQCVADIHSNKLEAPK